MPKDFALQNLAQPRENQARRWMRRALELAQRGAGLASPNPLVGAVLVDADGDLVGEGWHEYERREHAEIVALRQAGARARGAIAYVTLEPCSHTGRTGPCAQALIDAGVARVVVATEDPNPQVAGGGIGMLRAAGIGVECGLMHAEAQHINEAFARWIQHRLPFLTLKVAMTLDGRIAPAVNPHQFSSTGPHWITSEGARAEVQQMRHAADAILTGIGTVLADDPLLTDRSGLPRRRRLLRVILDSALRLPMTSQLVKTAEEDVLACTLSGDESRVRQLRECGVRVEQFVPAPDGNLLLEDVLQRLGAEAILSVMVEAGTRLNTALLKGGLVDRLECFVAPTILGHDGRPAWDAMAVPVSLPNAIWTTCGPDLRLSSLLRNPWPVMVQGR